MRRSQSNEVEMEKETVVMGRGRVVFHYNKAHTKDPENIPTWVIKFKGETYYIHHLESKIGFSTKETPDNPHTKGAIQFKGELTLVTDNNIVTAYVK